MENHFNSENIFIYAFVTVFFRRLMKILHKFKFKILANFKISKKLKNTHISSGSTSEETSSSNSSVSSCITGPPPTPSVFFTFLSKTWKKKDDQIKIFHQNFSWCTRSNKLNKNYNILFSYNHAFFLLYIWTSQYFPPFENWFSWFFNYCFVFYQKYLKMKIFSVDIEKFPHYLKKAIKKS